MRRLALIPALALLLLPGTVAARDSAKAKFLKRIGKSFEKSDAKAIAGRFPKKGKVELKLHGVKEGKYRNEQARSLLASFFKKIEPLKYELKDAKSGKFKMKYKIRADGTVVEGKTYVYLEKEDESWLIVGIVES